MKPSPARQILFVEEPAPARSLEERPHLEIAKPDLVVIALKLEHPGTVELVRSARARPVRHMRIVLNELPVDDHVHVRPDEPEIHAVPLAGGLGSIDAWRRKLVERAEVALGFFLV